MVYRFTYWKTLELGAEYMVAFDDHKARNWRFCRFIKVTPKGFNLLDLQTSKCIHKQHFYVKGMAGLPIPAHQKRFKVGIPNFLIVSDKLVGRATA